MTGSFQTLNKSALALFGGLSDEFDSKILLSDISGLEILEAKAEKHAGDLTSEVHLIIQLPFMNGTSEEVLSRQEEYLDTLRRNLAHPQVTCTSRVLLHCDQIQGF